MIVLSLFSLAALYWVVSMFARGALVLTAIYVAPLAAIAAPVYGLTARKNWARIYTCVLFVFLAVMIFVGNAGIAVQNKVIIALIYGGIIAGLLAWNVFSLLSKEVKQYFMA
jgi:hypothetical protein